MLLFMSFVVCLLVLTLTCMRSAGAFRPHKIVSSRERVIRKNEACNMLWSPGWRIQIVMGRYYSNSNLFKL